MYPTKMVTRRIFVHLISFSLFSDFCAMSGVPDFATLCPFNDFCTSAAKNITDVGSCCQKCSCDPNCYTTGTCCPDLDHHIPNEYQYIKPRYRCVNPKELIDSARNNTKSVDIGRKYRVVDRCTDLNMSKQYPSCENPNVLQDFVFVSDTMHGTIYRNKQCATCHGVVDTIDWRILIQYCEEIMVTSFDTTRDRNNYILENCHLNAVPAESIDGEIAECYNERDVVSRCNISGDWDSYDKAIEEACLKERPTRNTLYWFRSLFNGEQVFANVYCYLCNSRKDQHKMTTENVCSSRHAFKGFLPVFTALLDLSKINTFKESSLCSSTRVWDSFANVCRSLHCPLGQMPVDGNCVQYASSVNGFSIEFFLQLMFTRGNLSLLSDGWKYFENWVVQLVPRTCGLCGTILHHTNISSALYLSVELYTTDKCTAKQILLFVKAMFMKGNINKTFKYRDGMYTIDLNVALDTPADMEPIYSYAILKSSCYNMLKIHMYHLQICPRFMVIKQDLLDVGFDSAVFETTKDLTIVTLNSTDIVSVCVTEYFRIWESVSASYAIKWSSSTVIVAVFALQFIT